VTSIVDAVCVGADLVVVDLIDDDHGAAADFAIVVDFGRGFARVREWDLKLFKTGRTGDRVGGHGR